MFANVIQFIYNCSFPIIKIIRKRIFAILRVQTGYMLKNSFSMLFSPRNPLNHSSSNNLTNFVAKILFISSLSSFLMYTLHNLQTILLYGQVQVYCVLFHILQSIRFYQIRTVFPCYNPFLIIVLPVAQNNSAA